MFSTPKRPTGAMATLVALAAAFVGPVRRLPPGRAHGAIVHLRRGAPVRLTTDDLRLYADVRVSSVTW